MKDNDLLLYGGLAVAAYLLFMKKPATVPGQVQMVTPVVASNLPATGTSSLLSNITNGVNNIIKNIGPATFTPGQLISEPVSATIETDDLPQLTQTLPVQRPDTGALTNPAYAANEIAPTGYEDNIPGYYNNSIAGMNGYLAEEIIG